MRALALGLVTVATAGTPVPITLAMLTTAGGGLPPYKQIHKLEFYPKAGNTGVIYVKEVTTGNVIKSLQTPANGHSDGFCAHGEGNPINPVDFEVDAATSADGVYITAWVE